MVRLKPITVIALDAHAAAFCDVTQCRLDYDFGKRGRLTQMRALVAEGGSVRFEENLSAVADTGFDLRKARSTPNRMNPDGATGLFNSAANSLEPVLIDLLSATHKSDELEAATAEGLEITGPHVIYLVLSSCDPFANGVALRLAQLIRWLCATRFSVEAFSLEAVVLLPEMFVHAEAPDYSAAYALLKKLDHSATTGIDITAKLHEAPFHFCWLLDSRKSHADYLGSLADNLDSYGDAFAGFLTSEPERSGALITHNVRGRKPAYSTFGHGELFFPAEIAITRLSAAFACDIVTLAFLADVAQHQDRSRKMLLAVKQFVLSANYTSALEGIERDKGAEIWSNFAPKLEVREGRHREFISEMSRRHDEFKRGPLLVAQQVLEARCEQIRAEMIGLLDEDIDNRADAAPDGLREALQFTDMLIDPVICLHADAISDRPQNLVTDQRSTEAKLDARLGISVSNETSNTLLNNINDLRGQVEGLVTTVRLTPARVVQSRDEENSNDESADGRADPASADHEREKTLCDISEIRVHIARASDEYKRAINQEDQISRRARFEESEKVRKATLQAVIAAEGKLIETGDKLGRSRLNLEQLRQERQQFVRRYFILWPLIGLTVVFVIPGLLSIAGIVPGPTLWSFYINNMSYVAPWSVVAVAIYSIAVGIRFATGINRRVAKESNEVESLKRTMKHDAVQLVRAHNDQLRFEYDVYLQRMRVEIVLFLIEAARQKAEEIRELLEALNRTRSALAEQRDRALPASSRMRRSVLYASDIDDYYRRIVPDLSRHAESFAREGVKRSQVRQIPIEEFRLRLTAFARHYFGRLGELSIEDVLLREPELISPDTAEQRLRELNAASQPLLQLSDADSNRDTLSQRDATLWAEMEERDHVLAIYRKFCPDVTVRSHADKRALRVLTRFLYFPAYFLGQIDYFRNCYDRDSGKDAASLPDLIPTELGLDRDVKQALEQLLLGIALSLIELAEDGYHLAYGNARSLGENRMSIAHEFATEFTSMQLYAELSQRIKTETLNHNLVYQKLLRFQEVASNLERVEDELLQALLQKYHPWS